MIYDPDMVNTINNESYAEYLETQAMKNKILGISNTKRKQEEWNRYFGMKTEQDDSYLTGEVF